MFEGEKGHSTAPPSIVWRGYVHPLPVIAVLVLIVNDHALKATALWPLLSGKLSDLAGLFFFPLLVCALLHALSVLLAGVGGRRPPEHPSPTLLLGICGATALAFAAIQVSPGAAAGYAHVVGVLAELVDPLWSARATHTMDPTDLLALPATWLAWRHGRRFTGRRSQKKSDRALNTPLALRV